MGDLDWAQAIGGVTQGVLTGIGLRRQQESLDLQRQYADQQQVLPLVQIYLQRKSEVQAKQARADALNAIVHPSDDEKKEAAILVKELEQEERRLADTQAYLTTGPMAGKVDPALLEGAFPTGVTKLPGTKPPGLSKSRVPGVLAPRQWRPSPIDPYHPGPGR